MGISAGMKYKKLSDPTAPPIYDWGQCANNADSGLGLPTEINSSTSSDSPPSITLTASCIVWLDHYSNSVPGKGNLDTVWTKFAIKNLETNLNVYKKCRFKLWFHVFANFKPNKKILFKLTYL